MEGKGVEKGSERWVGWDKGRSQARSVRVVIGQARSRPLTSWMAVMCFFHQR